MNWDAEHQSWDPRDKAFNKDLHVEVKDYTQDVGVTGTFARTLLLYGAKSGRHDVSRAGAELLDRMWARYRTGKGISNPEVRADYKRFNDPVYVPSRWSGKMPNGDAIEPASTFLSLRSKYRQDPDWPKIEAYLAGGAPPEFRYHRFWAQADIALANATVAWLYPHGIPRGKAGKAKAPKPAKSSKAIKRSVARR